MISVQKHSCHRILFCIALSLNASAATARDSVAPCHIFGHMRECISVPLASENEDALAKKFALPAGNNGTLYLVRPYTTAARNKSKVFIDEKLVAELAPMTYIALNLGAGPHRVKLQTEDAVDMALQIDSGKNYFLEYDLSLWLGVLGGQLELLSAEQGQEMVLQSRLTKPQTR